MCDGASDTNWERVQELFSRAVELPAEQREDFIAQTCPDDAELANEVLSLIACDVGTGSSPLTRAMNRIIETTSDECRLALVGRKFAAYRITALLGHGGVGTVYLGERDDKQYCAKVAIKVVDSATMLPELGLRFRA
ncbi:MAG: hypothetical protein ABW110_08730 [Steroidobacteraceae bacterium]